MMVIAIQIPLILMLFVLMYIGEQLTRIANEIENLRKEMNDKDNNKIEVIE